MAIDYYTLISSPTLKIGVDMNVSVSSTRITYAPKVYRYDQYSTWNSGGSYTEVLSVDGTEIGRWTLDFEDWEDEESGETLIDSFVDRYVNRDNSQHTVTLRIYWRGWATRNSTGTDWAYASDGYHDWTYTVSPTYTITYKPNGGTGSQFTQTKPYNQAVTLASSGFSKTDYTLDGWSTSASGSKDYNLGASYSKNANITLYAHWQINEPSTPVPGTATVNSDNSVTLTWGSQSFLAERVYVFRYDGSSLYERQVGYASPSAQRYTDMTATADNRYTYYIRSWNASGWSTTTGGYPPVYTAPYAPNSVSGARAGDGTTIVLTVDNSRTRYATGFDVQCRAENSDTWTDATPTSSTGTPVTSMTFDNMGGQSWYFRVRNTRGELHSGWNESGLVVPIQPPMAPTLTFPSPGTVIDGEGLTMKAVRLEWLHNPIDGSAQTAAEVQYKTANAQSWTTATTTTAEYKEVNLYTGSAYQWRVRTKGVYNEFGPWSGVSPFSILDQPDVAFLEPSGTVEDMPIDYEIAFSDSNGSFVSGTLKVKLGGQTVYSEELPRSVVPIVGQITTDEFLPSSGNTYTFEATVRSSTTLEATATLQVPVNMGEPWHGILFCDNDPDTGYTNVEVGWRSDEGSVEPTYISLYRITDSGRVLIGDNLDDGDYVLDKYAPLNTPYQYEIVTHSAGGAVAAVTYQNEVKTDKWFVYWGENVAWAEWNPSGSYSITRPEKVRVHYVGRQYPVSYDGTAVDEAHEITWTVVDMGEWSNGFIQLMHDGGRGIYKSVDGKVFRADFELTNTPLYTSITKIGTVSLSITRIDGDAL